MPLMQVTKGPCAAANSAGFTLVEVLIAIFITALIGLGSWQLLNSSLRINERTAERTEEFAELQRFMLFLARDMQQILPRSVRNDFGDSEAALTTTSDFYKLAFTKAGWRNPLQDKRSQLQRVAYELDQENTFYRHYWLVLDRAQDSEPRKQALLSGIESLEFRFLAANDRWLNEWPPQSVDSGDNTGPVDPLERTNSLPRAVKVELEHQLFGELSRTFDLVQYQVHQAAPAPNANNNGSNPNSSNTNSGNPNSTNNGGNTNTGTNGGNQAGSDNQAGAN